MNSARAIELAGRCVRCGFCLDACPTYKLTGVESQSPRGRLRLMVSALNGESDLAADVVASIDACLGCRACETACPSGVLYGAVVEHFRAHIETTGARAKLQRDAKRGLIAGMEMPGLFAQALSAAGRIGRIGRRDVPSMPRPVALALAGDGAAHTLMPDMPDQARVGTLPAFSPALGERRYTVVVLQGCVMRVLYHPTNVATVRVLQRAGCDVVCPSDLGCCGALDLHAGYHESGAAQASDLITILKRTQFDAFVINSAGCGSTIREYGDLLEGDPALHADAAALAAKTRDVSEFLDGIGIPNATGRFDAVVAYHDACHLAHGQGVTAAPRRLLASVPGLTLVPLHEADMCCGSAGTYNLTQPDMARRLLDRKVANIMATGADIVAMGNPGCMAWIARGLKERGSPIRVMHVVEILNEAYCGG